MQAEFRSIAFNCLKLISRYFFPQPKTLRLLPHQRLPYTSVAELRTKSAMTVVTPPVRDSVNSLPPGHPLLRKLSSHTHLIEPINLLEHILSRHNLTTHFLDFIPQSLPSTTTHNTTVHLDMLRALSSSQNNNPVPTLGATLHAHVAYPFPRIPFVERAIHIFCTVMHALSAPVTFISFHRLPQPHTSLSPPNVPRPHLIQPLVSAAPSPPTPRPFLSSTPPVHQSLPLVTHSPKPQSSQRSSAASIPASEDSLHPKPSPSPSPSQSPPTPPTSPPPSCLTAPLLSSFIKSPQRAKSTVFTASGITRSVSPSHSKFAKAVGVAFRLAKTTRVVEHDPSRQTDNFTLKDSTPSIHAGLDVQAIPVNVNKSISQPNESGPVKADVLVKEDMSIMQCAGEQDKDVDDGVQSSIDRDETENVELVKSAMLTSGNACLSTEQQQDVTMCEVKTPDRAHQNVTTSKTMNAPQSERTNGTPESGTGSSLAGGSLTVSVSGSDERESPASVHGDIMVRTNVKRTREEKGTEVGENGKSTTGKAAKRGRRVSTLGRTCCNCGSTETRQWLSVNEEWNCHQCGQYWRKFGRVRPQNLWNRTPVTRRSRGTVGKRGTRRAEKRTGGKLGGNADMEKGKKMVEMSKDLGGSDGVRRRGSSRGCTDMKEKCTDGMEGTEEERDGETCKGRTGAELLLDASMARRSDTNGDSEMGNGK